MPNTLFDTAPLCSTQAPWAHLLVATPEDAMESLWLIERRCVPPLTVRFLRGSKARTKAAFMDECAAALQFPAYFGYNWDALEECLGDLGWIATEGIVLCILNGLELLDKTEDDLATLLELFSGVASAWNEPERKHQACPFHLVVQTTSADEKATKARWQKAGWRLPKL